VTNTTGERPAAKGPPAEGLGNLARRDVDVTAAKAVSPAAVAEMIALVADCRHARSTRWRDPGSPTAVAPSGSRGIDIVTGVRCGR
jgi:hypothetical protein